MEKIFYWLSIIGSICSSLGLGIFTLIIDDSKKSNNLTSLLIIAIIILITSIIYLSILVNKKSKIILEKKLLISGYKIPFDERSNSSTLFSKTALRSIDIYAGDVSWLERDLSVYSNLIRTKNIDIRILVDNHTSSIIPIAKQVGIKIRKYPFNMRAPFIATISDGDYEGEGRVLAIHKRALRPNESGQTYNYWFNEYSGENDRVALKSFKTLFDHLFSNGELV